MVHFLNTYFKPSKKNVLSAMLMAGGLLAMSIVNAYIFVLWFKRQMAPNLEAAPYMPPQLDFVTLTLINGIRLAFCFFVAFVIAVLFNNYSLARLNKRLVALLTVVLYFVAGIILNVPRLLITLFPQLQNYTLYISNGVTLIVIMVTLYILVCLSLRLVFSDSADGRP